LQGQLLKQKEKAREARLVTVQVKAGEAWLSLKEGKHEQAINLMKEAADLEDGMEKHPVTPGEVLPARELLGEMYLQTGHPELALAAFEQNLKARANRFNSLYGAAVAARATGDKQKLAAYNERIQRLAVPDSKRKELQNLAF
jgi:hypothetical protein